MRIWITAGIALFFLWSQNSIAEGNQDSSSTHNYSMVDNGTYGYQGALSDADINNGVATKPLIMMRYLGNKNGIYTILVLGPDLNNQSILNRVSCQVPCEYAKSETVAGGMVLNTQMLPVVPNSILGAMLADAISDQLVPFGQRQPKNNLASTLESRSKKLFQAMEDGDLPRSGQYRDNGESGKIKREMIENWSHPKTAADWAYLEKLDKAAAAPETEDECGVDGVACQWKQPFKIAEKQLRASGLKPTTGDFPYLALQQDQNSPQTAISSISVNPQPTTASPSSQPSGAASTNPTASTVPASCSDVNTCLESSLVAAKHEDSDGLRHLATIIDGFPKPDMGNKAFARDLNKRALDALKNNDYAGAEPLLAQAYKTNPQDVEIAANYGFVLVHQQQVDTALTALKAALILNPRRTATWVPIAEALAAKGDNQDATAALWIAYQWSSNQTTTINFYAQHAADTPADDMTPIYAQALSWIRDGQRPGFVVAGK